MSTKEVADGLVALCRQGKFDEASEKYYDANIVSTEADGEQRQVQGMDAIRAKMEWWNSTFEFHGGEVEGPWINDPFFIVKFTIDTTHKESGERSTMSELAVYEVANGKIVSKRFF